MVSGAERSRIHQFFRLPVECVFSDVCESKCDAIVAEYKIKKWTRQKKEVLIKEGWEGMQSIAKKFKKNK